MAPVTINIISKGLSQNVIESYAKLDPENSNVSFTTYPSGEFDVCVIIDDCLAQMEEIRAKKFIFFGSETIYPVDYFRSQWATAFLSQYDQVYGPYHHDPAFTPLQPSLPFMYNDNHGRISEVELPISAPAQEIDTQTGLYCIISNKCITETQYLRLQLLEFLSNKLGKSFQLFGNGFNPIPSKAEVSNRYTHSIAIENRLNPLIISEKYYDPIILKNNLFYLGGNTTKKSCNKYVTDLHNFTFDQIYCLISESLANYDASTSVEKGLQAASVLALKDNFITRILKVIATLEYDVEHKTKRLRPQSFYKKNALIRNPYKAVKWKYRKGFL